MVGPVHHLLDGYNSTGGHVHEVSRFDFEDGVWITGRCPEFIVSQQMLVDEGLQLSDMPDRRNTADHKASLLTDKFCICLLDRFRDKFVDLLLVHAI